MAGASGAVAVFCSAAPWGGLLSFVPRLASGCGQLVADLGWGWRASGRAGGLRAAGFFSLREGVLEPSRTEKKKQ